MPQLLVEFLSEDIPARMQSAAARDLERLAREHLAKAELRFDSLRAFAGPRRLTLVVDGLPDAQADLVEERKGPRVGAPDAAIDGFLRSAGLARQALSERGGVYFAVLARKGRPTAEVIAEMVPSIVRGFPWPRSMTWGSGALRWVRPLHRILCVFDRQIIPFDIDGLDAGDQSEGHRFMGEAGPFRARDFDAYSQALAARFVVLDVEERKRRIGQGARALCAARGLTLIEDDGLLMEVAGMAEWPVPLWGTMDPAFLDLPSAVIRTS
ncbi:MAG TPA: glycine--tRNA ligase subunit beta, partial [Caulobacteraceae bacterium]